MLKRHCSDDLLARGFRAFDLVLDLFYARSLEQEPRGCRGTQLEVE